VIIGAVVDDKIQGEIQITVIATGFELRNQLHPKEAADTKTLSAADFFSGAFSQKKATTEISPSFSNIEIPDFLKK